MYAICKLLPIFWNTVYMILLCYDLLAIPVLGILQFWRPGRWILPRVLLMQSLETPRSSYLCKYMLNNNSMDGTLTIIGVKSHVFRTTSLHFLVFPVRRMRKYLLLKMGKFWNIPSKLSLWQIPSLCINLSVWPLTFIRFLFHFKAGKV